LPLNVTNLNKSGPIGKHMKADMQEEDDPVIIEGDKAIVNTRSHNIVIDIEK
jgi:hypothetical protein